MSTRVSFDRALTYSHIAVVLGSCAALVKSDLGGRAVDAIGLISMLSLPVYGVLSIWLFVQAFDQGDGKKLAFAMIEIALSIVQFGFLIPQIQ